MALKWGIASAGNISNDFANALGTLADGDHEIVAVAARDIKRADEFAATHKISKAYADYDGLAKDPNVEVVYVGTLHPHHYAVAMLMLEHGKHVLCEKPLCMNEKECRKLIMYAERKKLFIMEAIWSRFFPSYQYLKKLIEKGALGDITKVTVEFGFEMADIKRITKKELGGGTILDLGIYNIQICQWVFDQPPKSIKATGTLNDEGCDMEMQAELIYGEGAVGHIKTSALRKLSNKAVIVGTKGQVTLNDFWCPTTMIDIDGSEKTWPLPEAKHEFHFMNSCGLRYEAEEVRRCIRQKLIQSDWVKHNDSLVIAQIEDEIRKQIGVHYDADD